MMPPLTPKDWETLSTYLDGQLSEAEKRHVQDLIALRPELKQGLEDLRRTQAVLRAAPRRRAPRNFTLSAEMAQKARPRFRWGWTPSFSFASAMAAVLLVLSFFFRVNLAQISFLSPLASQAPIASSQENASGSNPPIIVWNSPGMGGGGGPAFGMGGANGSTENRGVPPMVDSQPAAQATPSGKESNPVPDQPPALAAAATPSPLAETQAAAPLEPQPTDESAASRKTAGNNPILGIAPTEERGKMFVPEQVSSVQGQQSFVDRWLYVQIGLAGITVIFALAAFLAWRRAHH